MSKSKAIVFLSVFAILLILGTVFAFVSLTNGELGIYNYYAYPTAISLGLDLKGGVYAVFEAEKGTASDEDFQNSLSGTVLSLEKLLVDAGYTEAVVTLQGDNRIRVEVPDVEDPETIFTLIGQPATLEFKDSDGNVLVEGKDLDKAYVTTDENGGYAIGLKFNETGTKLFAKATEDNLNKTISIYIDGKEVMSPTVNSVISGGSAIITGNYTYETANEMAVKIQAGAFSLKLKTIESRTIGATLGVNALKTCIIVGAIGLAVIFVLMITLYKINGVAVCLSLAYYIINLLFFYSVFPWVQLSLSGIAGILVSIGMAVDANVIIFERTKDEYKLGKTFELATKEGFKRSILAILDGNITTLLGVIVIWILGAATIKGFAITLFIGVILSMFTALVVTRLVSNSLYALIGGKVEDKFFGMKRDEEAETDDAFENEKEEA